MVTALVKSQVKSQVKTLVKTLVKTIPVVLLRKSSRFQVVKTISAESTRR